MPAEGPPGSLKHLDTPDNGTIIAKTTRQEVRDHVT